MLGESRVAESMTEAGLRGKDPHNALFVDTFGDAEHAASLFGAILPPSVGEHLALSQTTLTGDHFVDEKLTPMGQRNPCVQFMRVCWSGRLPTTADEARGLGLAVL
jgi:hypothetical protein